MLHTNILPFSFVDYNGFDELYLALEKGEIDRFLYPDYKDLMVFFRDIYKKGNDMFDIVKVFEAPFQVGMVLSLVPELITIEDTPFLRCLRNGISSRERWVR